MKVLLVNGSARVHGNTATALQQIAQTLETEGIDTQIFQLGAGAYRDCIACNRCSGLDGHCVFDDDPVNEFLNLAAQADGFVFGTPVYYAHPSGRILSFLDRAFYAGGAAFAHKPGASIAVARRAGTCSSVDVLNKYFTINSMPVVSSTYWNMVHGNKPADVLQDEEGLRTMRNIGRAMADMVKAYAAARDAGIELHAPERGAMTNFIR